MAPFFTRVRLIFGAFALFAFVFAAAPAGAQHPTTVTPPASSVK